MKRVLWLSLIVLGGCQTQIYKPVERTGSVQIQLKTCKGLFWWCSGGYAFRPEIRVTGPDGTMWEILTPTNNPRDWDVRKYSPGKDEATSIALELVPDVPCSMPASDSVDVSVTEAASTRPAGTDIPGTP